MPFKNHNPICFYNPQKDCEKSKHLSEKMYILDKYQATSLISNLANEKRKYEDIYFVRQALVLCVSTTHQCMKLHRLRG